MNLFFHAGSPDNTRLPLFSRPSAASRVQGPGGPDGLEIEPVDGAEIRHVAEVGLAPLEGRVALMGGARHGRELQIGTLLSWKAANGEHRASLTYTGWGWWSRTGFC